MTQYIFRRVLISIPVLLGVSIIVFAMVHMAPGDPVRIMLGTNATAEGIEKLTRELGLDQPLYVQYGRFLVNALQGDFGKSIRTTRPVTVEIVERFPATLLLASSGMCFAVLFGVSAGVVAGANRDSWIDRFVMLFATLGVSIPSFWLGLMLIFLFSVTLGWFPVAGPVNLESLVLPTLTLGTIAATVIARLTRSSVLEVLNSDYIRTARAKGVAERIVLYKHALRNALIPVVTIVGIQVASLLGGTFIIEQVFAWPGIGTLAINAIRARDFPLVQAIVLFVASGYVFVNLIVDVLYSVLDPRIRYD
jgi:peptide/nickel transport system permease protein